MGKGFVIGFVVFIVLVLIVFYVEQVWIGFDCWMENLGIEFVVEFFYKVLDGFVIYQFFGEDVELVGFLVMFEVV